MGDRRWTIWQPDDSEQVPPSPGPMVMRIYAGPTLKPGERLELIAVSDVEPLIEAALRILARQESEGEQPFFNALNDLADALKPFEDSQ